VIELRAGAAHCTISPDEGGRLASLYVEGTPLLIERPRDGSDPDPMSWGSYPMAPWAGRVRRGRFSFGGKDHQLPINLAPHAIHGTVFTRPWHVDLVEGDAVTMSSNFGSTWPLGGFASQIITLAPNQIRCELAVTATTHVMPAVVGWHPWFVKPHSASLRFGQMYLRDGDGIPTGEMVSPTPGPWDDCFIEPLGPIALLYRTQDHQPLIVQITSDCDHWLIYDQPHHATCVEPQSAPPDAFNLNEVSSHQPGDIATVLHAGETLRRTMHINWREVTESEAATAFTPDVTNA
jgi:aldose 1-epimerase